VLTPAANRVQPRCAHFEICGGCALQHLDSASQLALKQQQLTENLERIARLTPQRWLRPFAVPPGAIGGAHASASNTFHAKEECWSDFVSVRRI